MKCLVAGGAGFIGSHLTDALINEGHTVVCIDNLFIGKKENISHLLGKSDFSFINMDITDMESLKTVFLNEKFDYVFHLAANSDIQASAKSPEIELKNTFITTYNIIECMRLYGVKKLFFSSTSAVYGEKATEMLKEDSVPLEPVSYYGSAKLSSEAFITSFTHMNDFETLIFRFPNVIGSRLTHGVVYDFINRLKTNGKELVILGDGTQNKPYMHVSDLINGIMTLKNVNKTGVFIYNIGVETKSNVTSIADIICEEMELMGVSYKYTGGNTGWKGDVPTFAYNLDKIYDTGWSAEYTSDEAVRRTVREVLGCKL